MPKNNWPSHIHSESKQYTKYDHKFTMNGNYESQSK